MRRQSLAVAVAAAALLGACGDDDKGTGDQSTESGSSASAPRYRYPPETVKAFVNACATTSGGQREICQCTIDELQQKLPFEKFAEADKAIRTGGEVADDTKRTIDDATESCRD